MSQPIIDESVQLPLHPFDIISIGAGGIVREAHQPAYRNAGWKVRVVYDPDAGKADRLAEDFGISTVAHSLKETISLATGRVVFDIATPAAEIIHILPLLPDGSVVMIQKPFGSNLEEAILLREICIRKKLIAAVNFQNRFIPAVAVAKKLIDAGLIGDLHAMESRMNMYTPWHLWTFLFTIPRMEMLYHSIHYLDLTRYFFGNPKSVYAKTVKHPHMMQLASVRSAIILDYGDTIQSFITTNHVNVFGKKYQDAFIRWEGTRGAIRYQMGKNINFPEGVEDRFEISLIEEGAVAEWKEYDIKGRWYPDAFMANMANLMCFAEGSCSELINSMESAFQTMQLVEAAYISSETGGTALMPV